MSGFGFLSPGGALVALAVLLPLAAIVAFERRARRVRATLQLAEPSPRAHAPIVAAIALVAALLAIAAAQPVVVRVHAREVRSDAEAYVVFDTSGSMGAALGPHRPTRLERAKRLAVRLRDEFPDVRFGVASFAELALPHLFPTPNQQVFAATVRDAVRIGEPPSPNVELRTVRATDLSALASMGADGGFFSPSTTRRVIVVFSDDESNRFYMTAVGAALRHPPAVESVFVHVWDPRERVFLGGRPDPDYTPDLSSTETVAQLATATGGRAYEERQFGAVLDAVRRDLGSGPTAKLGTGNARTPLAKWVLLAAFLPLGFVLRKRNL